MSPPLQERVVPVALPGVADAFGLLSEPMAGASPVGVLVVVGGPQYRAGSHRHFVELARHLAAHGHACLRFDHRGLGDAPAPLQSFEALDDDIDAGISALMQAAPALKGVVLWGLCDAAAAALLYVQRRQDPRVLGLALLNPWVRTAQSEARVQVSHYYAQRLRSPAFWAKLLRGGVGVGQLRDWWRARQRAKGVAPTGPVLGFTERMAQGWQGFGGPILLQLALPDLTAQEFIDTANRSWPQWQAKPRLRRHDHQEATHTFSVKAHKQQVNQELVDWLQQEFRP
jgi:uncharacterized protein